MIKNTNTIFYTIKKLLAKSIVTKCLVQRKNIISKEEKVKF